MRVDWNDTLLVYHLDEANGRYEVDEDTWGMYEALLAVKIETEEKIRQAPQADPLDHIDEDLKALRDMIPDDELLLLQNKRHRDDVVADNPGMVLAGVPDHTVELPPPTPPPGIRCPKNPSGGGHIPTTYMRHSNGSLLGKCKCGAMIQSPDCPHLTQTLRGNKVVCAECGRPQINNVGHWENEPDQAAFIDPNRFTP